MQFILILTGWVLLYTATSATKVATKVASKISSTILIQDSKSWDGSLFEYGKGKPEITVQKVSIKTNKEFSVAIHQHTMPLAGYIVKGSVRVVKESGESTLFEAGDAAIEITNQWHSGIFAEDTEIIMFYAGEKGTPLAVVKNETL